jgi:hypothetical protein
VPLSGTGKTLSDVKCNLGYRWWPFYFPGAFCFALLAKESLHFFLLTLIFACAVVFPIAAEAKLQALSGSPCRLHFFHTHTGERLNIVYRDGEGYDQESLIA